MSSLALVAPRIAILARTNLAYLGGSLFGRIQLAK